MSETFLIIQNLIIDMQRSNMFEAYMEDNKILYIITELNLPDEESCEEDGNGNGEGGGIWKIKNDGNLKSTEKNLTRLEKLQYRIKSQGRNFELRD